MFTADSRVSDLGRLPGLERLDRASQVLPAGELNIGAYSEAVQLLDIIRIAQIANLPTPDVGVGAQEISVGWTKGGRVAVVSVEGDGEAAYTYHVGDRFRSGQEAFMLVSGRLPDDLRTYLEGMCR